MSTIWKETVIVEDEVIVEMPRGSKILYVGKQTKALGRIDIWFRVPMPSADKVRRRLFVRGTGHGNIPPANLHLGTVFDGPLVWHIFDGGEIK